MMMISDRKRIPLEEVEEMTAQQIDYWLVYYSKEPSDAQRNEFYITQLLSMFYNANFKNAKSTNTDFIYPDKWKSEIQQSEIQQDVDLIRSVLKGK